MASLPAAMKAVVFDGPHKVSLQERPVPAIKEAKDIVVKVHSTALCGSELHTFRGLHPSATGFIMGHEFTGEVVAAGEGVKSVKVGDKVVSPFTTSCGECFYCKNGATGRCTESLLLGCEKLDGAQAEYVRVPNADGTVMVAPQEIDDNALILMADIFPTGFFGVANAFNNLSAGQKPSDVTAVVIGCGPVGLCAIVSALEYKPKHLFAIDGDKEGMMARIKEVTDGRGADVVIEVVGLSPALRTAFDVLRPFGFISSIGVHNTEIPWNGTEAYDKNLRLQMGRCPVRSVFPDALKVLAKQQHRFGFMFEKIMPLSEAVEGYDLFDKMKVQKVIFKP
ncbi:alcohol dehydrogenase [Apiospora arundinis]